jgi:transcriptional antiterminator RfaH
MGERTVVFDPPEPLWFCVKTKPKLERAARLSIEHDVGVEVFCPLLRFERARRSGRVRVTEAMFPGYVFARFAYAARHRHIAACRGVSHILKFGGLPAVVPDPVIEELRQAVVETDTIEIPTAIVPGEEVQILKGAFAGVKALVSQVLPAQTRIKVLLELLGTEREVEVEVTDVLPAIPHPLAHSP